MIQKPFSRLVVFVLCLLTLLSLVGCTADMDLGQNTELSTQFMEHVMADNYDAAYDMVKATVADGDFRAYWVGIQTAVKGAVAYEMKQIGWHVNRSDGLTTRTTAYQVYLDTDRIILLRTITRDDIAGIAGIHFSDVTDFIHMTDTYVPVIRIVLWVISGLCMAFTIWMLVDCIRRKMKYKVLWAILIFFGISLTLTIGESPNISFTMGLFFQTASINADPALASVVTKLVVPVGAILYLCLRKKFALDPNAVTAAEETQPAEPADTPSESDIYIKEEAVSTDNPVSDESEQPNE